MRIISGKFKKRKLFSVEGNSTRPTTDAVKESIFSILQDCEDLEVLDLYAGSGSLGFEALSRGAKHVEFVDFAQNAIGAMKQNIEKLSCGDLCHINRKKVSAFISKTEKKFDLIFVDPPYNKNLIMPTITAIFENDLLKMEGELVVEHYKFEKISEELQEQVVLYKDYGSTCITILKNRIERENDEDL